MGEPIRLRNDEEAFIIEPILDIMSMEEEANQTVEDKLRNQMTQIFHAHIKRVKPIEDDHDQANSFHDQKEGRDSLHIEVLDMKEKDYSDVQEPLCDIDFIQPSKLINPKLLFQGNEDSINQIQQMRMSKES